MKTDKPTQLFLQPAMQEKEFRHLPCKGIRLGWKPAGIIEKAMCRDQITLRSH